MLLYLTLKNLVGLTISYITIKLSEEYGLPCTSFTELLTIQLYCGYTLYKILLKLDEKYTKYGKIFIYSTKQHMASSVPMFTNLMIAQLHEVENCTEFNQMNA
jgi:hypothetical protein